MRAYKYERERKDSCLLHAFADETHTITGSLSRTSLAFLEQPSYKTDQDLAVS